METKIISVGDSHCMYTFSGIARETRYLPGVTMHRVGRDGPWLSQQVENMSSDELQYIIFCFGEIDVRCHIYQQITERGRDEREIIKSLVDGYMAALGHCKHPRIGVLAVVPPCNFLEPMHNPEYPFRGTHEDRLRYTRSLNTALRDACAKMKYLFIDVTEHYSDEHGFLRRDRSDGCVHIGNTTWVRRILDGLDTSSVET